MSHVLNSEKEYNLQLDFFSNMLIPGAKRVGKYNFPQVMEEQFVPTQKALPFNYLLSLTNPEEYWIHCFCEDKQFERLWNNFEKYVPYLQRVQGLIATDYSLYRDYSDDLIKRNCERNRTIAYAAQQKGIPTIPTAGFGGESTWNWCFDGLPKNSTLAITTNGTLSDPEARRLFVGGVDALIETCTPYALVVCGKYPQWLNEKYPSTKIVPIPSFSQQMAARRGA